MATRLYLRDTPSYEAPTAGKKSTALPNAASTDGNSGNPFENRSLLPIKGETLPDSTLSRTSIASTAHVDQYMGRFTSRKLAAQTITAQTWTAALVTLETNAGANSLHMLSVYVWRPSSSSVVGYIWDAHTTLGVEWIATLDGQVLTFAGAAVTAELGDVLVMELWRHTAGQTAATAWLQQHNYNSYVDVTGGTVADPASYLETPQNLTFDTVYFPVPISGVFVETPGFAGPVIDGNGNLYVLAERLELTPSGRISKSTNGGKTWTAMDTANEVIHTTYEDFESASLVLSGTKIKYARMRSGSNNVHLSYHEFNTSGAGAPDTWATDAGKACTATTADVFTSTAHGYRLGDAVKFSALTGGAGITVGTTYFIIAGNLAANTFQVSTSQGGASINITSTLTAGTVTRQCTAIMTIAPGDPDREQLTLLERSNGDLVVIYGEWVSASVSRIVYRKKVSGGEWGSAVLVHTGATGSVAVVGASDKIHIFIKEDTRGTIGGSTDQIVHRSLSSADVLSSAEAVNDTAVISPESMLSPAVYYDDGGVETVYCAWAKSNGFLAGAFVLNDGTPSAEETITDQIVWINPPETTPVAPVASLAVDQATKTIYCTYSNNPSFNLNAAAPTDEGDLYLATRTHGVGWGTDVELRDGVRAQLIMSNVYTHSGANGGAKVLGIFYDDANGPFYDEFLISSGAVEAVGASVSAVTVSGAGQRTAGAAGAAIGAGAVAAAGQSTKGAAGVAAGAGSVAGAGQGIAQSVGTAEGAGSGAGVGQIIAGGAGSVFAAGAVNGVSGSSSVAEGAGAAVAVGSVAGSGGAIAASVCAVSSGGSSLAVGGSTAGATAQVTASGTASGASNVVRPVFGAAAGAGSSSASGRAIVGGSGSIAGAGSVDGISSPAGVLGASGNALAGGSVDASGAAVQNAAGSISIEITVLGVSFFIVPHIRRQTGPFRPANISTRAARLSVGRRST